LGRLRKGGGGIRAASAAIYRQNLHNALVVHEDCDPIVHLVMCYPIRDGGRAA